MKLETYVTSKYENYRHHALPVVCNNQPEFIININPGIKYQKILGFGGAFTEAACYTLSKISQKNQEELLNAYFNPDNGLNYNLGRIHMNSSDFALGNYTYVEDNDLELKTFDISREKKYVIPTIKKAEKIAKQTIDLLVSPWSPPAWMKSNGEMNNGGKLLIEFYPLWADYYLRFLDDIKKAGLHPFALTVQNEPAAKQTWDSCLYTKEEERDFVKFHLGPKIINSKNKDIKIFIWDHNRDLIVERAKAIFDDPEASKFVAGTALHWYVSEEFEKVGKVHDMYPNKQIIFSEGCIEGGPHVGVYETGERYSRNIIGDFSNHCEAFIDWNLTLNEIGGPNHVGNYCDAPILSDTINDKLIFNSSYYHIGHFSKHVKPGARRISSEINSENIKQICFQNPDGSIVLVVLNESEKDYILQFNINENKKTFKCLKKSIITLVSRGVS